MKYYNFQKFSRLKRLLITIIIIGMFFKILGGNIIELTEPTRMFFPKDVFIKDFTISRKHQIPIHNICGVNFCQNNIKTIPPNFNTILDIIPQYLKIIFFYLLGWIIGFCGGLVVFLGLTFHFTKGINRFLALFFGLIFFIGGLFIIGYGTTYL